MSTGGLERIHDRLDEVLGSTSRIALDVAVIRAEHAAVRATVEAMTSTQREHDQRIQTLEDDRHKLRGMLVGVAASGAAGGVGVGAIFRLFGLVP